MNRIATKICHVDGCERKHYARGLCNTHWRRTRRRSLIGLNTPIGINHEQHGLSGKNSYRTWTSMIKRTTNPNDHAFKHYGQRGIKVCERWKRFSNFYTDMGDRPEGTSLDRINVNGDYQRSNCRWASASIQAYNIRLRSNNTSGYRGVSKTGNYWRSEISFYHKRFKAGVFETREEAAWAYDQWALELWGDDAITNFEYW